MNRCPQFHEEALFVVWGMISVKTRCLILEDTVYTVHTSCNRAGHTLCTYYGGILCIRGHSGYTL